MTTALVYSSSMAELMITYPDQSATFEGFCSEGYGASRVSIPLGPSSYSPSCQQCWLLTKAITTTSSGISPYSMTGQYRGTNVWPLHPPQDYSTVPCWLLPSRMSVWGTCWNGFVVQVLPLPCFCNSSCVLFWTALPINILHVNLRLGVCFPENSIYDRLVPDTHGKTWIRVACSILPHREGSQASYHLKANTYR